MLKIPHTGSETNAILETLPPVCCYSDQRLNEELVTRVGNVLLFAYQEAITNPELELRSLPGTFAHGIITTPMLGFIWMNQIKDHPAKLMQAQIKSIVLPVGNIGLTHYTAVYENKKVRAVLESMGYKWVETRMVHDRLLRLYCNYYRMDYYDHLAKMMTDPKKVRFWRHWKQKSWMRKMLKWDKGWSYYGVAVRGGSFLNCVEAWN